MRAVLDPNVLIAALISTGGPPRQIVSAWADGQFELIASPTLLAELREVLVRPKFRRWVSSETAAQFIDGLEDAALLIDDQPRERVSRPTPTTTT
ncbi:MAG: putative toxin-antitoxin system toxin component, PIN family [Gaiellaceae bacterium]